MTCLQQAPLDKHRYTCALKYYLGTPPIHACEQCIQRGENTPEHAAALFARVDISHPPFVPRVSGCCDSAMDSPIF
jgi:hypothetical protein